jgi:protoporphyrinogen oxidase
MDEQKFFSKKFFLSQFSRRSFLKAIGASPLMGLPVPRSVWGSPPSGNFLAEVSPVDRTIGEFAPREFSGDAPDRAHRILWDKKAYLASKGRIPEAREKVPLVIIGGGISGLFAAYLLRSHKPIVLENAPRFGGNARAESWNGIDYALGAAYFMEPEANSVFEKIYADTGIKAICRTKSGEDPVWYKNARYNSFWDGETDPKNVAQFLKLKKYFGDMVANQNGVVLPNIPITDPAQRPYIDGLDSVTFAQHLEGVVGGKLHPHIQTAIEYYCWSSFNASSSEIGAASGLNFYSGEFSNIYVAPGGNAAVAEKLLQATLRSVPQKNFRPGALVFDVTVKSNGVSVVYEDRDGKVQSVYAQAVVMACPKFVVGKILNDLEPTRLDAYKKLRYRSYLVANVLLEGVVPDNFYDYFLLGDGSVNVSDVAGSSDKQKVTDVTLGTFSKVDPTRSVVTLYRGLPFDGARGALYSDGAYARFRGEFERQIQSAILPMLNVDVKRVRDLRLTRWGHPLPVADRGLIANKIVDSIRAPFRERIFFIEQDNWMLPGLETGATEAVTYVPEIEKVLKRRST